MWKGLDQQEPIGGMTAFRPTPTLTKMALPVPARTKWLSCWPPGARASGCRHTIDAARGFCRRWDATRRASLPGRWLPARGAFRGLREVSRLTQMSQRTLARVYWLYSMGGRQLAGEANPSSVFDYVCDAYRRY